jgi:TonB family protein
MSYAPVSRAREVGMRSLLDQTKRALRAVFLSSAFHVSLIVLALLLAIPSRTHIIRPVVPITVAQVEIAGASHAVKIKLPPMPYAAHTRHPDPDAEAVKRTTIPMPQTNPSMRSGGGAPAKENKGDSFASAAHGNGSDNQDMRPAFPVFSPRPPVSDRSLLPPGEQKIVVDVNVDALGQVVSESLVKGLGNKLDQIVLDIVKTWRFQPATIDGKAVPTQAELIFPFNPSYPITDS